MLVDVIELRRDGRKLPREVVCAAEPVRGVLSLDEMPGLGSNRLPHPKPLRAGLMTPESEQYHWLLKPLDHARVTCIRPAQGLIIVGLQDVRLRKRDDSRWMPQAWYVRLASAQDWQPLPEHLRPTRP